MLSSATAEQPATYDWEGIWASEQEWCQFASELGEHDPSPIKLTRLEFFGLEVRCVVKLVYSSLSEDVLNLKCAAEGEEYEDQISVRVIAERLFIKDSSGSVTEYVRCHNKSSDSDRSTPAPRGNNNRWRMARTSIF
jgi:hypothetical protein